MIRIARPTDQIDLVTKFYSDGLGLNILEEFGYDKGFRGVKLGLPGDQYHLVFFSPVPPLSCPAPTLDNLVVFYFSSKEVIDKKEVHMKAKGYLPVEPMNPYWKEDGITFEDPDGWRVVLMFKDE
jgi:catechol 2,3-dioxygenase-like lactoylglutathione lyase family enzyme